MITKAGHIPLRLPHYCFHLNPVELIWAKWKKITEKHNFRNNFSDFNNLMTTAFDEITDKYWSECCRHTLKLEYDFRLENDIQMVGQMSMLILSHPHNIMLF